MTPESLMESEHPDVRQLGSTVAEITTMFERGQINEEERNDLLRDALALQWIDRDATDVDELRALDEAVAGLKLLLKFA